MRDRKWTIAALGGLVLLGACGGTEQRAVSPASPDTPVTPSARPDGERPYLPVPPPLVARNGTDLAECRDGDCEVVVQDGQRIPLDPGLGPRIDVRGVHGTATFTVRTPGGAGLSTVVEEEEGSGTFSDAITVIARRLHDRAAVVAVRRA
ncbi:hypothetical protein [Actinomadura kijaniata]|uniref:hypothetical protein n=1 Tax=Actinomadura kijaniata TaxID=46161 RepID=UPI000AB514EE|nr:hypothetical protein [Actinomadura kijaniata]